MSFRWIKASQLENWTDIDSRRAQELLPLLIRKLIIASIPLPPIKDLHFPCGDSIQYTGFDGRINIDVGNLYTPDGFSILETGTDENILSKANEDFSKRTRDSLGVEPNNTTFVFVTSRRWKHKTEIHDMILVPYFHSFEDIAIPKGCRIVVPFGKNDTAKSNNVEYINRQTREQFSKGLEEMGMDSTKAYDLSDKTGRSLLALRRQLATVPWVKKPKWVEYENLAELIPALFVGTWNEHKQGDREIISRIAGCDYEAYVKKIAHWLTLEDSPIRKISGIYQTQKYSSNNSYNWELEEQNILQERKKALIEIYNQAGEDGIITLLNCAEDIYQMGRILVDIFGLEIKWDFVLKVLSLKKPAIVANYLYGIYIEKGINEIAQCLIDNNHNFTDEQKVDILIVLPFVNDVWILVDQLGEKIKAGYWSRVSIGNLRDLSSDAKNYVIDNLLQYNRPYTAINVISYDSSFKNTERIMQVLEKGLQLYPTSEFNGLSLQNMSHEILRLFEKLYQALDVDTERLARLEWYYLPIFRFNTVPKTLVEEIKKNPQFFVELICWMYKGENEEHAESTQEEINRAHLSYELMEMFKSLPGFKNSGEVDKEYFTDWMLKALNGCREMNRGIIGEQEIGKLLSYSPIGTDGAWPHEIVRDFIEKYYTGNIEKGFCIGRYNQRGAYTRTGGKEERKLAQDYYSYADRFRIRWPKCAAIMRSIGDDYIYQAKREEEEEQF